jgi:hypothetical protein
MPLAMSEHSQGTLRTACTRGKLPCSVVSDSLMLSKMVDRIVTQRQWECREVKLRDIVHICAKEWSWDNAARHCRRGLSP